MKVKFGAIVTEGRGKLGGHVASRNAGGSYFRTRVTPVNPRTEAQQAVRNAFGQISTAWRTLDQSARDAWNAAVENWSYTDIFGDSKTLSGFALHQKVNMNRNTAGAEMLTVPVQPGTVNPVPISSLEVDESGNIAATIFSAAGALTEDTAIVIEATRPVSAGKKFVGNLFRIIDVQLGDVLFSVDGDPLPLDITENYESIFGSISGKEGMVIYVQVRTIDVPSGNTSIGFGAKATI